jgi:hypothetical protein
VVFDVQRGGRRPACRRALSSRTFSSQPSRRTATPSMLFHPRHQSRPFRPLHRGSHGNPIVPAVSIDVETVRIAARARMAPTGVTKITPCERGLDPWRDAAARLPLGRNEKLFLEIADESSFAPETRVLGNPRDRGTGVYYIRPFGWPVIECFLGDQGARMIEEQGPSAGFARAIDQLVALFGSGVNGRRRVPACGDDWSLGDEVRPAGRSRPETALGLRRGGSSRVSHVSTSSFRDRPRRQV